jgi:hypothetical protein
MTLLCVCVLLVTSSLGATVTNFDEVKASDALTDCTQADKDLTTCKGLLVTAQAQSKDFGTQLGPAEECKDLEKQKMLPKFNPFKNRHIL